MLYEIRCMIGILSPTSRGDDRMYVIMRERSRIRVGITESGGSGFGLRDGVGFSVGFSSDAWTLGVADALLDPARRRKDPDLHRCRARRAIYPSGASDLANLRSITNGTSPRCLQSEDRLDD